MIRVIIADDSPTAQALLANILDSDSDVEIVGQAQNGKQAGEMTQQLQPDVIVMDIHMPVMDGFEATHFIMAECPTPIVIVSASTMVHEVETSMKALRAGALTLLLKPLGPTSPDYERSKKELIETVKAMADVKVVQRRKLPTLPDVPTPKFMTRPASATQIVAVATSTGGPPALQQVLAKLPGDFPLPILVVQHIAHGFIDGMASWLDSTVPLHVKIPKSNEPIEAGTVYLAPDQYHLGVSAIGRLDLSTAPPIAGFRPSATHLFASLARTYKQGLLSVIMTGMGRDGVEGLKTAKSNGSTVIAQDKDSCVVFGMPGAAVEAGVVDRVLDVESIPRELLASAQ